MANGKWNPDLYLRFETYRTRAARDLLARVELEPVRSRSIADLGCGPGNSTALLAERWPSASITGVDHSTEMLARAREHHPELTWVHADLASWRPATSQDLIFANASFQWVANHAELLPALCAGLRTEGVLAFQVPSIDQQPAAAVYRGLLETAKWRAYPLPDERLTVESPSVYHDVLAKCCQSVEIWETIYYHLLAGHDEMVLWYQSTGLRPVLASLPDDLTRRTFMHELADRYREQFPSLADGRVLFPFRRLFVLAIR
ncbi:MAG: methyltransferase domain-containing protein [Verrucomicrobia bacterium]|nr:methyltransferase domain-containing protein [Verrucomicrobiota bacterium]